MKNSFTQLPYCKWSYHGRTFNIKVLDKLITWKFWKLKSLQLFIHWNDTWMMKQEHHIWIQSISSNHLGRSIYKTLDGAVELGGIQWCHYDNLGIQIRNSNQNVANQYFFFHLVLLQKSNDSQPGQSVLLYLIKQMGSI